MIKIFRKIRQNLLSEGKTGKYLKYAIGEIFLVVIGILIALQINNWNDQRIEHDELNGLLQSISSSVKSDIRDLNLLITARTSMTKRADSIFSTYVPENKKFINIQEATYINIAFINASKSISFNPNLSALDALNNSNFLKNLQGSDLSLLLSAYLSTTNQIKKKEDQYHETMQNRNKEWVSKFKNSGLELFMNPWNFNDENGIVPNHFLEVLRDNSSKIILISAIYESSINSLYEEQILMGNKLIEMIENSQTTFDEQTKLEFSGILYSFADADYLSILINGKVPTGFDLKYSASGVGESFFSNEKDYLVIKYPEDKFIWGAPYFGVNALNGRVNEMDFSSYSKILIEMKGNKGGEVFDIAMKDTKDPPDGSESRVKIELTKAWKTFEIKTSKFETADMKNINAPINFIFLGSKGKEIHIKSIQFIKE